MKRARPENNEASAPGTGAAIVASGSMKPGRNIRIDPTDYRARRLLAALLRRPRSRLEAGNIAGAANLPDLVLRLRGLGFELPCERIKVEDRDGCICRPGVYSASSIDRNLIRRALRLPAPHESAQPQQQAPLFNAKDEVC